MNRGVGQTILECGDTSLLWNSATGRQVQKRGHARALPKLNAVVCNLPAPVRRSCSPWFSQRIDCSRLWTHHPRRKLRDTVPVLTNTMECAGRAGARTELFIRPPATSDLATRPESGVAATALPPHSMVSPGNTMTRSSLRAFALNPHSHSGPQSR